MRWFLIRENTMSLLYRQLLDPVAESTVAESAAQYHFLTERHVQVMWLNQKYFASLKTDDGSPIEVVSPGVWNAEGGPDFKKAHLKIGGRSVRGDVEIHLRDEGWQQHRHHLDPLYNQVVLHISFWKPNRSKEIVNADGEPILRSYFEGALTIPEKRIARLIDLDLYPYKKFCGSGRCADQLFKKLPEKNIKSLLCDASLWRLDKKRRHLNSRVEAPELHLPAGIAMGLGYKDNAEAFLDLYQTLSDYKSFSETTLFALALRLCGFFSKHFADKWQDSPYYQQLQEIEIPEGALNANPVALRLQKIRPLNHPIRRIAYLVKMIRDPSYPQLFQRMEAHWCASWQQLSDTKKLRALLEEFCEQIPSYEDTYWNRHYTFEANPQEKELPLIGHSLKMEMLVNTFFPLLYTAVSRRKSPQEMEAFQKLYALLKGQPTRKSAYLQHRFFGETPKRSLLAKANMMQGAYQLHHDFCIHYEASCEGCPFIDRYRQVYSD